MVTERGALFGPEARSPENADGGGCDRIAIIPPPAGIAGTPVAPAERLRVLLVEDSPDDAELVSRHLTNLGIARAVHRVTTRHEMESALADGGWDVVLSDYDLPGFGAREALELLERHGEEAPFVIVSHRIGEAEAIALARAGAVDFVLKADLERLPAAIERALREAEIRRARNQALHESESRFKAIASNLPGMVFQAQVDPHNCLRFLYVSDGCEALLGIPPRLLVEEPARFVDMIVDEDREAYGQALQALRHRQVPLNWEGRVSVPGNRRPKWINLRASTRTLADGRLFADGIAVNITRRRLVESRLRESQAQLRELSSHLQSVKEQERAEIAREIHDDLGGLLTSVKIDLLWLARHLQGPQAATQPQIEQKVASMLAELERAMDAARRIARNLRPGVLDFGVVAAIEWQAREFHKRMNVAFVPRRIDEEIDAPPELATALFRVFQEGLNNIAKHAGASRFEVSLYVEDGSIWLELADDGRGLREEDARKPGAFGLRSMRERIQHFGGAIRICGMPDGGTRLTVRVPLRPVHGAPDAPAHEQLLLQEICR